MQIPRAFWIILIIIGVVVAAFILPFASWLIADEGMAATSGSEFCVGCHSMEPMENAYLKNVHGGAGPYGVQAQCVDCHLDHSSSIAYFFDKIRTGTHDIWVEYTQDTHAIDWEAKREERESFTYDSGCKHCHVKLKEATMASPDAFIAHKAYYLGETKDTCVSCHPNVGHTDLEEELIKHAERYQQKQLKEQQQKENPSSGS